MQNKQHKNTNINNAAKVTAEKIPSPPFPWQKAVWEQLQRHLIQDTLPPALLFSASTDLGQINCIQAFIQQCLCAYKSGCQQCRSCQWFAQKNHPDYWELANDQALSMEVLPALQDFLALKPYGKYKLIYLGLADSFNRSVSNALLKLLEEPAANTCFILNSQQTTVLLPTLKSRCIQYKLQTNLPAVSAWLTPICNDPQKIEKVLLFAAEQPFLAKKYLTDPKHFNPLETLCDCLYAFSMRENDAWEKAYAYAKTYPAPLYLDNFLQIITAGFCAILSKKTDAFLHPPLLQAMAKNPVAWLNSYQQALALKSRVQHTTINKDRLIDQAIQSFLACFKNH